MIGGGLIRNIGAAISAVYAQLAGTGGAALIGVDDPLGDNLARQVKRLHSRAGRVSAGDLPRLMNTLKDYRHDLQTAIPIVGVGSSVGVGASLTDPANDAPVAHFATKLKAALDPAGLYNFVVSNQSVNGSVVTDFATAWAAVLAQGYTLPGVVVFAYGMNDQSTAGFNSGQTFPGFIIKLREAIRTVRNAGWDAVILTTPHASIVRYPALLSLPNGINQGYPTFIASPVSDAALQPSAADGAVTADFLGDGVTITVSHRALRINQAMRSIARNFGVMLIDVERYWFEALQKYKLIGGTMAAAEGYLFNAGENVHPNDLGHQLSYHRAMDEALTAFAHQTGQAASEARMNGRAGVNSDTPAALLEVKPAYGDTAPPLGIYAATGMADPNGVKATGLVFKVEDTTGDLVAFRNTTNNFTPVALEAWRLHGEIDNSGTVLRAVEQTRKLNSATIKNRIENGFNIAIGVQSPTFSFPANSWGRLTVNAYQPGIGRQRAVVEWVSTAGAVTFGAVVNVQSGGVVFTGPTATGLTPQVTNAANGTTLMWEIEQAG